jgi:hypothetical protein
MLLVLLLLVQGKYQHQGPQSPAHGRNSYRTN